MCPRIAVVVLLSTQLAGCAFGNTIDYQKQVPELTVRSGQAIAVGVQDLRPYVVSGHNTTQFVGLQRGGYGNPFGVHTESGDPLADDFADTIVNAFKKNNITAQSIVIPSGHSREQALRSLLQLDAGKYLLVFYTEWKSDTMMNVALLYNVTAQVFDRDGKLLAQNNVSGRENLGGDFINPPGHAAEVVPIAFRKNLERLLGSQDIVAALE